MDSVCSFVEAIQTLVPSSDCALGPDGSIRLYRDSEVNRTSDVQSLGNSKLLYLSCIEAPHLLLRQ